MNAATVDKARDAFAGVDAAHHAAAAERAKLASLKLRHDAALDERERLREAKDEAAARRLLKGGDAPMETASAPARPNSATNGWWPWMMKYRRSPLPSGSKSNG